MFCPLSIFFHILSLAKLLVEELDHDLYYRYKAILLVSTLATTLAHRGLRVDQLAHLLVKNCDFKVPSSVNVFYREVLNFVGKGSVQYFLQR